MTRVQLHSFFPTNRNISELLCATCFNGIPTWLNLKWENSANHFYFFWRVHNIKSKSSSFPMLHVFTPSWIRVYSKVSWFASAHHIVVDWKKKMPEDWLVKICIVWPGKLGVCCIISISLNQPKLAIHTAYLTPELISQPPFLFLMKNTCAEIAALKASNLWPLSYCERPLFLTTLGWWRPNLPIWMIGKIWFG